MRSFIRLRRIQDDTGCQILRGVYPACPAAGRGELTEGLRMTARHFQRLLGSLLSMFLRVLLLLALL
jgi:hypothetical protein